MNRRRFLQSAAAGLVPGAKAAAQPDILLILADDLGYGDLSSWGSRDLRTPHIDRLAASGIRFDRFYANSPVCSPTRAALLTGRYPDCVGVPGVIRTAPANSFGYLTPHAELLPRRLHDAGYDTALIGKWHLGLAAPSLPNDRGFDHFHGFLGDMMDDYENHRRHGRNYMRLNGREIDPSGHATELFTGWAIDYLNARRNAARPSFLYLAYNAPHAPIQPPREWLERVRSRAAGLDAKREKIVALIEHLDDCIGRVVEAVRAGSRDTLIVFTSDNGGDMPAGSTCGDLRGGKGDMYEGGIRVPMCAAWPGRIAAGARCGRVGLSMDLFPTLCEAAGAPIPREVDGMSLWPDWLGAERPVSPRDLVWVRREGGPRYQGRDYYGLRRGDWKLLQNTPFEPYGLYHLPSDPQESRDLAKSEPKIHADLIAALSRHVQRAGATPWQPPC